MSEDSDYSNLSLEDRLIHKVWKVRLGAYEESIKLFENSRNEADECFQLFNQHPDLLKTIITDLNVVAQETGMLAFSKYLEYGGTPSMVNKCKTIGVISSICEKGLSSSRAGTKGKSVDGLLFCIELLNSPDSIIEDMLPFVQHRLPKLVAGVVNALGQIIENFGCSVIKPSPIIEVLPKLFAHADRNVRTETSKLTVELYKWMKDTLTTALFDHLKPVQQKDLLKAFEPFQTEIPQQKRLTKVQQEQQQANNGDDGDVNGDNMIMDDEVNGSNNANGSSGVSQFDPFELMDPIDVISKIPSNFSSKVSDSNWKERKAALEEVVAILSKAPKINPNDDYGDLIAIFSKCMKDANIQVVQLAANCVEFIAKGLRKKFLRYYSVILVPMLERTKEKKPSVADALSNALDAVFESTSLSDILEGTISTMSHKTPQIKISSTNYLQRCLSQSMTPPSTNEIDTIMSIGVKLLSESQEPIRQASTQMIGTLMKITGERELKQYLEKVDDNRKSKILKCYETAEVKASGSLSSRPASSSSGSNPSRVSNNSGYTNKPVGSGLGGNNKKPPSSSTTIPSKRLATSPAKRSDQQQKVASYGRSLTGRPLASNNSNIPKLSPATAPKNDDMEIDSDDLNELKALREEKKSWSEDKQKQNSIIEKLKGDNFTLVKEVDQLKVSLEKSNKETNNSTLMIQQKESQISRLNNDMDNAKLKIRDLEQTIEMMKLQQKQVSKSNSTSDSGLGLSAGPGVGAGPGPGSGPGFGPEGSYASRSTSPYKMERNNDEPRSRITSGELSSRVNRLSIDTENKPEFERTSPRKPQFESESYTPSEGMNFNDNESWQKAALVTSQLKARIEKMKARSKPTSINI